MWNADKPVDHTPTVPIQTSSQLPENVLKTRTKWRMRSLCVWHFPRPVVHDKQNPTSGDSDNANLYPRPPLDSKHFLCISLRSWCGMWIVECEMWKIHFDWSFAIASFDCSWRVCVFVYVCFGAHSLIWRSEKAPLLHEQLANQQKFTKHVHTCSLFCFFSVRFSFIFV